MGIEPTRPAWKAGVLPLNYTRKKVMVEGEGFEPSKAEPTDLQSVPVDRLGIPPFEETHYNDETLCVKLFFTFFWFALFSMKLLQLLSMYHH